MGRSIFDNLIQLRRMVHRFGGTRPKLAKREIVYQGRPAFPMQLPKIGLSESTKFP
jgi:hypothetical protein